MKSPCHPNKDPTPAKKWINKNLRNKVEKHVQNFFKQGINQNGSQKQKLVKNIKTTWASYPTIDNYCSRPLVGPVSKREFKYPSYSHSAEPCPDQAHEDLLDTINWTAPGVPWSLVLLNLNFFTTGSSVGGANLEDTAAGGPMSSMDPGNHRFLISFSISGMGILPTVPIVGTIFNGTIFTLERGTCRWDHLDGIGSS